MKECRFCKKLVDEAEMTCGFCGYDFKTGTMSKSFNPQGKPGKNNPGKPGLVSPQVRKFAFIGLIIVLASASYKHIFSLKEYIFTLRNTVMDYVRPIIGDKPGGKKGAGKYAQPANKTIKKKGADNVLRIEGISYDPAAKSFVAAGGELFSEGESIRGVVIKKINKDSVDVIVGGEEKTLFVGQDLTLPKKK